MYNALSTNDAGHDHKKYMEGQSSLQDKDLYLAYGQLCFVNKS
jgi:hypothetical protein